MFVSFAEAVRTIEGDAAALTLPERGLFGVFLGERDAIGLAMSALDAGARTSRSTDDVAELIDGFRGELRGRGVDDNAFSFALLVVEDDALAFFAAGAGYATLRGPGWERVALAPALIPFSGDVRFFRAYVRQGTRAALATTIAGGVVARPRRTTPPPSLAEEARWLIDTGGAGGDLLPGAAIVVRVDDEPRIRS